MQNLPSVTEINREQQEYWKPSVADDAFNKADMFADFLNSLAGKFEEKISETPVADVSASQVESAMNEVRDLTEDDFVSEPQFNEQLSADTQKAATNVAAKKEDKSGITLNDMKDVKMTQRDLKDMKKELKATGFTDQEIKEISKKIESDEGLTWGGFVEICAKKMVGNPVGFEFTASQQKELQSFFEKLGFATTVAEKLISDLAAGDYKKVMKAVEEKLGSMDPDKFISMNDNEVRTFLATLKLPQKVTQKLAQALSGQVASRDIKKALEVIGKEVANNSPDEQQLVRTITDALENARERLTGQEVSPKDLTAAKQSAGAAENFSKIAEQAHKTTDQGAKASVQASKVQSRTDETVNKDLDLNSNQKEGSEENNAWKEFISKVAVEDKPSRSLLNNSQNAKDALFDTLTKAAVKSSSANESQAQEKITPRRVINQVQDGILKNLGQGRKQLTIQLTPEGLGKVNVMLQVQNKEVQAVLRVENHETAAIVADQMEQVRQALAEQGLKVSKLEVQTGLAQSHGNDEWFGDKGHNQAMEKEARAMMQARIRSLRAEAQEAGSILNVKRNPLHESGLHVVA